MRGVVHLRLDFRPLMPKCPSLWPLMPRARVCKRHSASEAGVGVMFKRQSAIEAGVGVRELAPLGHRSRVGVGAVGRRRVLHRYSSV